MTRNMHVLYCGKETTKQCNNCETLETKNVQDGKNRGNRLIVYLKQPC